MRKLRLVALLVFTCAAFSAFAQETLITKPSAHGPQETMDRLETIVKDKGMTVFARIDHRANAEAAGMEMPAAEVLIFGKPQAGTKIMNHDIKAGLDLPMRVLVHEDEGGTTWITYRNPRALGGTYQLGECPTLGKMDGAMAAITDAAAQ